MIDVMKMRYVQSLCRVTSMDRVGNERVERRGDVREKVIDRVLWGVLKCVII